MTIRLIPRQPEGWWCLTPAQAARLPEHAVIDGVLAQEAEEVLRAKGFFKRVDAPYAVTVLTTTACNLGCAYCFQNTGADGPTPFAPTRIERSILGDDVIDRIVEFTKRRMEAVEATKLSLLLFGGEPLLNVSGCLTLLNKLRPLGLVDADMVTNAVLLTERVAMDLERNGLNRIQVTFDGGRDEHDQARVDHAGRGTYDQIMHNVASADRATNLSWQFRVNVSHRNVDGLASLVGDLGDLGLRNKATVNFALVDDVGVGYDNSLRYSNELADRYIGLIDSAMDHGLAVPPMGRSVRDCSFCKGFAGQTGAVINADGYLYSCWETAGRVDWRVGDIENGYLPDSVIRDRWVACDYAAASHGEVDHRRAFYDRIDAHTLERSYGVSTR